MKIPALLTCLLAAVLSVLPVSAARADDVSFDVFYNSLADDGDWYNTPEFGYVWQPSIAYNNAKWRPYSDGYWAQTDDGWTWVSYENFGWATYHYGRWTNLENTGWVWVPGYDWGPGWVSWRTSNDYVGWAPLPPRRASAPNVRGSDRVASVDYNTVEDEGGYYDDVDQQYDIGPANYCFVQTADFGAPVLREVIVPPQRNIVIVENTFNVTRITYRRDNNFVIVHNDGPDFGFIRTRVHQPIQELRIERRDDVGFLRDRGPERRNPNVVRNGVFQIAAPQITHQQVNFNQVRPPRVKQELTDPRVEHGWRNSGGDQASVERVRQQFQQQARERSNRDGQRPPPQANVPPVPNVPPTAGQGGFRADADRQARRDAAQRDREQREAARNGGNNPPAGAQPFNQGGNQPPTANNERENRRDQRQQAEQAQQAQQAEQRQQRQQAEQTQQAERQQQRQQAEQNQQNAREQRQQREQAEQVQRQQQQDQQRQQREQQQQQRQQEQQQRQQAEQTQRQQQQEQRQQQREGRQQDQPPREQRQQEQAQRQQEQQAARQQQQEQQAQERQQRQGAEQAQRQQEQEARQQQQQQQAERQQQRQQAEQGQRQQQQERAQQQQQERAQQQQQRQQEQGQRQQEQGQRRQEAQQQRQQPQPQQGNSDDDKRKQHPNN